MTKQLSFVLFRYLQSPQSNNNTYSVDTVFV